MRARGAVRRSSATVAGVVALGALALPVVAAGAADGPGPAQQAFLAASCPQNQPESGFEGLAGRWLGIPGHLERALGTAFGGAAFGGDPERFHLGVAPGGDRAAAEAIVAECGVGDWVVFHDVAYPHSAVLAAVAVASERLLGPAAPAPVVGVGAGWSGAAWGVDVLLHTTATPAQADAARAVLDDITRETGVVGWIDERRSGYAVPTVAPAPPAPAPVPTLRAPQLLGR
ncbi:hypothetical protein ACVU7I_12015, partial [Patulibacter sp. S7RM1-6]